MVIARTLSRPITIKAKNIETAAKLNERTIITTLENLEKLPDIWALNSAPLISR